VYIGVDLYNAYTLYAVIQNCIVVDLLQCVGVDLLQCIYVDLHYVGGDLAYYCEQAVMNNSILWNLMICII